MLNISLKIDPKKYPRLYHLMWTSSNRPQALERALERRNPENIAYWNWDYEIHDWRCSNCNSVHPARVPSEVSGLTCPTCGALMIGSFLRRERDGDYEDR